MERQLFKKIMSGLLSVTMLLTMVPDIWMPVHAEIVRKEIIQANAEEKQEKTFEYTVFSSNQTKDLTLSGWKSNFTGNIYTGKNFTYNGSEFYVNGRIDAVGSITTNGWKTEITERNEAAEALGMPDFSEAIIENAGECAYYEKSPSYIQDKNIVNGSIKVNGNVNISGTTFEGDCYIIAEGDITYNVQTFNSKGRVVLYSKTGNITVNGSDIDINGILYAPKGKVSFNTYDTTLNGRIFADNISFNGSIFNISGSDADLELIGENEPEIVDISAEVPTYCKPNQTVNVQIKNLNQINGLTYTAKFNNEDVKVSSTGEFTVTMPETAGEYSLTISAKSPKGTSDTESYTVFVDDENPQININADRFSAFVDDSPITVKVTASDNYEIKSLLITLNCEAVILDNEGNFSIPTDKEKNYIIKAEATDCAGNYVSEQKEISVVKKAVTDTELPQVDITFDKPIYYEGDTVVAQVAATDNVGVTKLEFFYNGKEMPLDADNKAYISGLTLEENKITVNAYDAAGNKGSVTYTLIVEKPADTTPPELTVEFEKPQIELGESLPISVTAKDDSGNAVVTLTCNGTDMPLLNNTAVFTPDTVGEYSFTARAQDEAGNYTEKSFIITVTEKVILDNESPSVSIKLNKDTYFQGDNIVITVTASDNIGVTRTVLLVDGAEVPLDINNSTVIYNADLKTYSVKAIAYDAAGNSSEATASIPVNEASAPVITASFDKESYTEGDSLTGIVSAVGQAEITSLTVTVNGQNVFLNEAGSFTMLSLAAGDYKFIITAQDANGLSSNVEKNITVSPVNTDNMLSGTISSTVEYGETAVFTVNASDEIDKNTITVLLNGESIPLNPDLTYTFTGNKLRKNTFAISAMTTSGAPVSSEVSTTVIDSVFPELTVTYDKDSYEANEDITATVSTTDNCAIKRVEFCFDGKEYAVDANGKVVIPSVALTTHTVSVRTWDTYGNCTKSTSAFVVVYDENGTSVVTNPGDENSEALNCEIYTPSDGQSITAPITVIGTASGTDFVKYKLEYAALPNGSYVTLSEGTAPVTAGSLGMLDTTLLKNGLYNLRLTVYSATKNVQKEITVSVEGQMKVGNYSIAFQDMDVNVYGLPLTVIRSYDSRDRYTSGDFGYGWDVSTSGATLTESCSMGTNWKVNIKSGTWSNTYSVGEKRSHIVTVNWGNGKTEKFNVSVKAPNNIAPPSLGVSLIFTAQDGTTSKLEALGIDELMYDNGFLADLSTFDVVNINRYKLTKQDGTVYIINKDTGVESITDTNGNVIQFTKNGVIHSAGKSITYNRDASGRITSIVSPTGKTVEYTYDANGDLTKVKDISGEITEFKYEDHYLTEIIDPRGVRVSKNIYDDDGRLIKTIDSDGNEIVYDHDIDGRQEVVTDRSGNSTVYTYDSRGNVLTQTDAMGHTIKNTYDSNGNLQTKTDAMGNVTSYNYDSNGNLLGMTDAEGHTVTNSYNTKGQLTSISAMGINAMTVTYDSKGNTTSTKDAMGNDIDYGYDGKGNLTGVTDEIGTYMNMTYDSNGNVMTATNGAGTTVSFTYDSDGNCASKTLSYTSESGVVNVTENYFYDNAGNLVKIIDSKGNVTTTDYNSMGKVSCATDEKNRKTFYDYDDFGNLVKITYPDNTTETFTYDREGRNLTATDRMGRTVTMTYDKVGNLLSKTYPNGAGVSYKYDANYRLIEETSASGAVTRYEYDKIGRNTAIIDALNNRTEFKYNDHSQLESMKDPKGNIYTYSYDLNGNRIKTTYPNNTSVSSAYDARGRITSQTDQHGYTTTYTYDGADRLTSVKDELGNEYTYNYDEVGNLVSVTDANNNTTRYSYDELGRCIKTTNAAGKSAYVTYDNSGNILTSTDYSGNTTTYTYDSLDRVESVTTKDGTISYTYTTDGLVKTVTDSTGTTKFDYDTMNGLTDKELPDGTVIHYNYDKAGRVTAVRTPYGTTSYEYDTLDRLIRVVDRNGLATVYEYDANGNRTAVRYANGMITSYSYDTLNRLIEEKTIDKDTNVVAKYVYTLGVAGERLSVTEPDRKVEYTYDRIYRLIGEKITENGTVTEITYTYDAVGNRLTKTENGVTTEYIYNSLNQLVKEGEVEYTYDQLGNIIGKKMSDRATVYTYDDNGNLIKMVAPDKSALYVYDANNRLIKATVQDGTNVIVEEYTYDFAGNRTSKATTTDSGFDFTKYVLDTNSSLTQVIAELNADGTVKAYYIRGTDLISQERDGKISYYLYDGHGSVRMLADENGNVTDTYDYDAFGNLTNSTGSTANNYRYCGEQFDGTTGLYYLRARYMNPNTGTFISMDSYSGSINDPVSLHKYLYANANPVMYSDPSGYMSLHEMAVSIAAKAELAVMEMAQNNWAMTVWRGFIGGMIAVGDVISKGDFTPEDLTNAFIVGFGAGVAFYFLQLFLPIKVMMALTGLGVIGGFAGATESFSNGDFWQGIYRSSVSTLGGVAWWKTYGGQVNSWINSLFRSVNKPAFPNDPNNLFPKDYPGLTKTTKSDGKIIYEVEAGEYKYRVEYHPNHGGEDHYNGDHYHVKKQSDFPPPGKNKPVWFRIPNYDPNTPTTPGGGTFAPGDELPTKNK